LDSFEAPRKRVEPSTEGGTAMRSQIVIVLNPSKCVEHSEPTVRNDGTDFEGRIWHGNGNALTGTKSLSVNKGVHCPSVRADARDGGRRWRRQGLNHG